MILGPQPIISRLNRCRHEESRAREVWWGGSEHVKAWNNLVEVADGDRQPVDVCDPKYGNTIKRMFYWCCLCCILTASWHNYHKLLLKNSWINTIQRQTQGPFFTSLKLTAKALSLICIFSWKAVQLRGVECQGGYKYLQPFLLGPFKGLVHRCIP